MLSPTKLITGVPPQLSLAVTLAVSGAGTALAQATVTAAGQLIAGGRLSLTVIVCVQVALLPQASVSREVRARVDWLTQAVTLAVSGAGTALAQATVTAAGQLIAGGRLSLTVIVWVQVALLPQAS